MVLALTESSTLVVGYASVIWRFVGLIASTISE